MMDLQEAFDAGFEAVKTYVERSFDAYESRLVDLERRIDSLPAPKDGKDADLGEVRSIVQSEIVGLKTLVESIPPAPVLPDIRKMVDEAVDERMPADLDQAIKDAVQDAVAAIPKPQDGKSVSVEDVLPEIEARVASSIASLPPARDGVSVTIDDVAPMIADEVERRFSELPPVKDGEPGRDADPELIRSMIQDAVSALPPAKDGQSVTVEDMLPVMEEALRQAIGRIEFPKDGRGIADVTINTDGDLIVDFTDGEQKNAGRAAGWDGADVDMEDVMARVTEMFNAIPKPIDGKDGKLPVVKSWSDGVHYEGDVVTYGGSLYQAQRDTGKSPDHEDWLCIAERGRDGSDGRSLRIRGLWTDGAEYSALDIVALNGASFVAKRDNPGTCPGEDWQLVAAQGKRGHPGERGLATKGEPGRPGLPVASADVDDEGMLTLTNGDGSTVVCDLYPLLSKLR